MSRDENQPFEGPIAQAFRKMAQQNARMTPEAKAAHKAKVAQDLEAAKARGIHVVENPSGHRITLSASGPNPGAPLFTPEPHED